MYGIGNNGDIPWNVKGCQICYWYSLVATLNMSQSQKQWRKSSSFTTSERNWDSGQSADHGENGQCGSSSGLRTRHIDIRYHYVRDNLEGGIINIEFFKSVKNNSDVFTKNLSQEIYDKHVTKFLAVHAEEYKHWTLGMGERWRCIPHV
jgi:hypothetical protein